MGQATSVPATTTTTAPPSGCPTHQDSKPTQCPVDHAKPAQCPVDHSKPVQCPVDSQALNSLNQIPNLSQSPAPKQTMHLPLDRTESSIPRDQSAKWEYPSPQQFYNALVRKGWETPEEHVEVMVEIHNFLNEQAWQEVLKWERRAYDSDDIQLARFKGRPGELSPKARFWMFAGWLLPSRFNTEPPFDRHDWVVRRPKTGDEVRYVIDYYSAPPEPDGSPVFSLDVRPALDSFGSIKERIAAATEDVWASFKQSPSKRT